MTIEEEIAALGGTHISTTDAAAPAAPGAPSPIDDEVASFGGKVVSTEDATPEALADDPNQDPSLGREQRKNVLLDEWAPSMYEKATKEQYPQIQADLDKRVAEDPTYKFLDDAHKLRVAKMKGYRDYSPEQHYYEATEDLRKSKDEKDPAKRLARAQAAQAQAEFALDVAEARTREFADATKSGDPTTAGGVWHAAKEGSKDFLGMGSAIEGRVYRLEDAARMGLGALNAPSAERDSTQVNSATRAVARAALAGREVEGSFLNAGQTMANLYEEGKRGIFDRKKDIKQWTREQIKQRLEEDVQRNIRSREQNKPENLKSVFGGKDQIPYNILQEIAGGEAAKPTAYLHDYVRWGEREGRRFYDEPGGMTAEQQAAAAGFNPQGGKRIEGGREYDAPGPMTEQEKRSHAIQTDIEFQGFKAGMQGLGFNYLAKHLAGAPLRYGGKILGGGAKWMENLVKAKPGGLTTGQAVAATAAAATGHPVVAGAIISGGSNTAGYLTQRVAQAAQRLGGFVELMGKEIQTGKTLAGGSRTGVALRKGAEGTIQGTVSALPFGLTSPSAEDGISLVASLGLMHGLPQGAKERWFGTERAKGYGRELAEKAAKGTGSMFDETHNKVLQTLDPQTQEFVQAMRGLIMSEKDANGVPMEMHALDLANFQKILAQQFPDATPDQLANMAKTNGIVVDGNRVFLNSEGGQGAGQAAAHEGGHLVKNAIEAVKNQMAERQRTAIVDNLYSPDGAPVEAFTNFIAGYNAKTPGAKLALDTPENAVKAEDEYVAEHMRNLVNKRGGAQALGEMVGGGASIGTEIARGWDRFLKENGMRKPDKASGFDWTELPQFTKTLDEIYAEYFKGAQKKGPPEASIAGVMRRNAERMAQISEWARTDPGKLTPEIGKEFDQLQKDQAELQRHLDLINQRDAADSAAAGVPPAEPAAAAAPAGPDLAQARANVEAALVSLGRSKKDAKAQAAAAQGNNEQELLRSALSGSQAAPAVEKPGGVAPEPATPIDAAAAESGKTPAGAPLGGKGPEIAENAPESSPSAAATPSGGQSSAQKPASVAEAAPETGTGGRGGALAGGIPSGEPAPRTGALQPPSEPVVGPPRGRIKTKSVMPPRTADDDAAAKLIRESENPNQAALDLASSAARGNEELFQQRENGSYTGVIDLRIPEHRAMVRHFKIGEGDLANIGKAGEGGGKVSLVDYWSASKEDVADITAYQRGKELAADKEKRVRELMQRNKAILFTGVTGYESGKMVMKGISVDKLIANIHKLIEASKRGLTEQERKDMGIPENVNEQQILEDLNGYFTNQKNNYVGDGSAVVQGETVPEGAPPPYMIPRTRFELLNAALGLDPAKMGASKAQAARDLALANKRMTPEEHKAGLDPNRLRRVLNERGAMVYEGRGGRREGSAKILEPVYESLNPEMINDIRSEQVGERDIVRDIGFTGDVNRPFEGNVRPNYPRAQAALMPDTGQGRMAAPGDQPGKRALQEVESKGLRQPEGRAILAPNERQEPTETSRQEGAPAARPALAPAAEPAPVTGGAKAEPRPSQGADVGRGPRSGYRIIGNGPAEAERFHRAISEAARDHKFGAAVEVKDVADYAKKDIKMILADDDSAGVAVTKDGDLVSVFKHPRSKANVSDMVDDAVKQGAVTLDAYDINGVLPSLYNLAGFRPVGRIKFNRDYAPKNWNYELAGEPDIVLMVQDPTGKMKLPDNPDYNAIRDQVPYFESFDDAIAARSKLMAEHPDAARALTQEGMEARKEALPPHSFETKEFPKFGETKITLLNKNGDDIGEIFIKHNKDGTTSVGHSMVITSQRGKGYGEALYREAARQAQAAGSTKLISDVVSEAAMKTRKGLFKTTAEQTFPGEHSFGVESKIPWDVAFMPDTGKGKQAAPGALSGEEFTKELIQKSPPRKGALAAKGSDEISKLPWAKKSELDTLLEKTSAPAPEVFTDASGKKYIVVDKGDHESMPIRQEMVRGKPKTKNGDPVYISENYDLVDAPSLANYKGPGPKDPTTPDYKKLAYDVTKPQQKKIDDAIRSGAVDYLADLMAERTREALKNPDVAAGQGWYSRMRENLLKALGPEGRDIFAQLLGATSAKTPVNDNFLQAKDAYEGYQNGKYKENVRLYNEMMAAQENGTLNDLVTKRGYTDVLLTMADLASKSARSASGKKKAEYLKDAANYRELARMPEAERKDQHNREIMELATNMIPRRSNGQKFNANSKAVLKVLAGKWWDNRNSPKTPNFAGNLSGRTLQATIDVWAARFLRQLMFEGHTDQPWRIQPKSEKAVNKQDFAMGQEIFRRAAERVGMNPDDLQAVLWFAEKHNWDDRGWTGKIGAAKTSFDDMFHLFFPKGKEALSFKQGEEVLAQMKKAAESEQLKKDTEMAAALNMPLKDYIKQRKQQEKAAAVEEPEE